jgi:F-type H+-transporting ATPase subunit epsilon
MRLEVTTPFATVLQTNGAIHIRAEDSSGAFGILHGHADFLTVLAVSVLIWRDEEGCKHYIAVRGGLLSVHDGGAVTVATPEAVAGEDLHRLQADVLTRFHRHVDEERAAHTAVQRLHLAAIRQIMRLLRPELGHAPPLG